MNERLGRRARALSGIAASIRRVDTPPNRRTLWKGFPRETLYDLVWQRQGGVMILVRTGEQPRVAAPPPLAHPWGDHPDAAIAERHRSRPIPPPANLHLPAAEVDVSGAKGHHLADSKAMG
jgi:hypothetical protein